MNIAIVGSHALSVAIASRLAATHTVLAHEHAAGPSSNPGASDDAQSLRALGQRADVVLIVAGSDAEAERLLLAEDGVLASLAAGKAVIDLTPGDPENARRHAKTLAARGLAYIDAPIHCELLQAYPENAAMLCGGDSSVVEALRPLLETICPAVIHFGEAGSGRSARLVVGAIAVCNRMVTYEAAAMGRENGLSMTDMATVLNRCSGANSGTARVLPALDAGTRSTDTPLTDVVRELRLASTLATRAGAPMTVGHLVHGLLMAAVDDRPGTATLDDTASRFMSPHRTLRAS